jgi:hypothetical protein
MTAKQRSSVPVPGDAVVASRGAVWFALLGGGTAWTLHLLLAYAIAEFGCLSGLGERQFGGLSLVAWLLLGMSVGALGLGAMATLVARRMRNRFAEDSAADPEEVRATGFSGRLAYVTNLAFTVVIAVQTVPIFYFWRKC